jgi:hypothetical protein
MSTDIILTFALLGIIILLSVKEWLRVDVIASCVMLTPLTAPWVGEQYSNWRGSFRSARPRPGAARRGVCLPFIRAPHPPGQRPFYVSGGLPKC